MMGHDPAGTLAEFDGDATKASEWLAAMTMLQGMPTGDDDRDRATFEQLKAYALDYLTGACRVCQHDHGGLPGDTHEPCRRQLAAWEEQVRAIYTDPRVRAAHAAVEAAKDTAARTVRDALDALDVPEWVRKRAWADYETDYDGR